jgi:hypothetical protein
MIYVILEKLKILKNKKRDGKNKQQKHHLSRMSSSLLISITIVDFLCFPNFITNSKFFFLIRTNSKFYLTSISISISIIIERKKTNNKQISIQFSLFFDENHSFNKMKTIPSSSNSNPTQKLTEQQYKLQQQKQQHAKPRNGQNNKNKMKQVKKKMELGILS